MSVTLELAEQWMRRIAEHGGQSDTEECHRLVVAELDRLRAIEHRARCLVMINEPTTSRAARVVLGEAP